MAADRRIAGGPRLGIAARGRQSVDYQSPLAHVLSEVEQSGLLKIGIGSPRSYGFAVHPPPAGLHLPPPHFLEQRGHTLDCVIQPLAQRDATVRGSWSAFPASNPSRTSAYVNRPCRSSSLSSATSSAWLAVSTRLRLSNAS